MDPVENTTFVENTALVETPIEIVRLILEFVPEYGFGVNQEFHKKATQWTVYATPRNFLHATGGHFDGPGLEAVNYLVEETCGACPDLVNEFVQDWWSRLSPYTKVDILAWDADPYPSCDYMWVSDLDYDIFSKRFGYRSTIMRLVRDCEIWEITRRMIAAEIYCHQIDTNDLIKWIYGTITRSNRGDEMIALIMLYFHNRRDILESLRPLPIADTACIIYYHFMVKNMPDFINYYDSNDLVDFGSEYKSLSSRPKLIGKMHMHTTEMIEFMGRSLEQIHNELSKFPHIPSDLRKYIIDGKLVVPPPIKKCEPHHPIKYLCNYIYVR